MSTEHLEDEHRVKGIYYYYYLLNGKMFQVEARADKWGQPFRDHWMNTQLRKLERDIYERHSDLNIWTDEQREAETVHVHGRGWYGLRRGMVDFPDQKGIQASVRNVMLGWMPSNRVPELVYQGRESEQRYQQAAETREEVTEVLPNSSLAPTTTTTVDRRETRWSSPISMRRWRPTIWSAYAN